MEQFVRLQSLTLLEIEHDSLDSIFTGLCKLNHLREFSFDDQTIRYKYSLQGPPSSFVINNVYVRPFSQLNRVYLSNSFILTLTIFPHLRHLKVKECFEKEFQKIFQNAPKLISLSVNANLSGSMFNSILSKNQLREFRLKIRGYYVSLDWIERFLLQFPCLKHLELRAAAETNIADGNRWKTLTSSLITFHFKFNVILSHADQYLLSFRTAFWIEEKQWFVAYYNASLFSIPYFTPTHIETINPLNISFTTSDRSLLLNQVTEYTMNAIVANSNQRFNHIKILKLEQPTSISILKSISDLTQLKHLTIPSLNDLLTFLPLEDQVPQLNELTIREQITKNMIEQYKSYQFKQIMKLNLNLTENDRNSIFEGIFFLFPFVQYLQNRNGIQFMRTMIRLIDGFQFLVNASFYCNPPIFDDRSISSSNPIFRNPRRLANNNCTWKFYHASSQKAVYNW